MKPSRLHRGAALAIALLLTPPGVLRAAEALAEWNRVRLDVVEPASSRTIVRDAPVSVGLIFPRGQLTWLPGGRVTDDAGRAVPFEAEPTGWWEPERSNIKWLLLHFRASTDRTYFFERGKPEPAPRSAPIAVSDAHGIAIDTGVLRVGMDAEGDGLFRDIRLNDKRIARSAEGSLVLKMDDGAQVVAVHLEDWKTTVEESTPMRASIRTTAFWKNAQRVPVARVDVRCQFFRGEAFMRVEHTLTWMVKDVQHRILELSFGLAPEFEKEPEMRIAIDGAELEWFAAPLEKGAVVAALQRDGKSFTIRRGEQVVREGGRLGGAVELRDADGRGIGIALRHAWQRYPAAWRAGEGELRVQFCPAEAPLSFEQEAIMTPAIFHHPCWKKVRQLFNAPPGGTGFYDNYSDQVRNGYLYTAEGAAFTHEMLISFRDSATGRSADEMNRLAQSPLVLRQDPALAMSVPFMGFEIMPRDVRKYPEIERAVDQLGRMAMGRWVDTVNFGLLRFGMTRWGWHQPVENPTSNFYRWMDGTQYSQQLIPWLLFMRGGDRRFFDDALIVSRFAMDLHVNHFNTRGCPTGYMAGAGSALPFKPFPFHHYDLKMQKIHFLAYAWHLTGDRRAKEVMDEVIAGTKAYTLDYEGSGHAKEQGRDFLYLAAGGRENYNMNVFWVNAWEETFDPEILRLAVNNRKSTTLGEYDPATNTFGTPRVYLYDGLVPQQQLSGDAVMRDIMLRHLGIETLSTHGGIRASREDSIAYSWAWQQTHDRRYADAAWDLARGLADIVPEIDFDAPIVPQFYPDDYTGNSLLRLHLLPILVGATLGDRLGLDWQQPRVFHDNFFQMWKPAAETVYRAEVYLRPRQDGALAMRCLARGDKRTPLEIEVWSASGGRIVETTAQATPDGIADFETELLVPRAKAGEVIKLIARKTDRARFAVVADAALVHHLPLAQRHAHESLNGSQNATPQQLVTRTTYETMSYFNRVRQPFTLRDAHTGGLLLRPKTFTEAEAVVATGRARLIVITTAGCRAPDEWQAKGVEPYFADRPAGWFHPGECGWPAEK